MPVDIQDIGPPTTLAGGASINEEYWFGDFWDVGVCHCTLATEPQFLGHLEVSRQGRIGYLRHIGGVVHFGLRRWTYTVNVVNRERQAVDYNLRVAVLTRG
jgi:hypothetical protein